MRPATAALLACAMIALPAAARPPREASTPIADARLTPPKRPAPAIDPKKHEPPKPDACLGLQVAPGASAPFSPGEELGYALSVAGVSVGRLELKAGRPRSHEGGRAESFFGRARTSGLAATLKNFEGRYMAVVEPKLYLPLELRAESVYGADPRTEIARFSRDHRGVAASFRMDKKASERSYAQERPIYDLLTLLYHARRLDLREGLEVCQEVYADKRLWRMDATVRGVEEIRTPVGVRRARLVTTRFQRMPHADFDPKREPPWIEVDLHLGDDAHRAPLSFTVRTKEFTAKGELTRWATADRAQEASWEL